MAVCTKTGKVSEYRHEQISIKCRKSKVCVKDSARSTPNITTGVLTRAGPERSKRELFLEFGYFLFNFHLTFSTAGAFAIAMHNEPISRAS